MDLRSSRGRPWSSTANSLHQAWPSARSRTCRRSRPEGNWWTPGRTSFQPARCSIRWPLERYPPGDTSAVIFDAILNRDPRPAAELNAMLPPDFVRILDKALEKDRDLRCQTATELKTHLSRLKRDLEFSKRRAKG